MNGGVEDAGGGLPQGRALEYWLGQAADPNSEKRIEVIISSCPDENPKKFQLLAGAFYKRFENSEEDWVKASVVDGVASHKYLAEQLTVEQVKKFIEFIDSKESENLSGVRGEFEMLLPLTADGFSLAISLVVAHLSSAGELLRCLAPRSGVPEKSFVGKLFAEASICIETALDNIKLLVSEKESRPTFQEEFEELDSASFAGIGGVKMFVKAALGELEVLGNRTISAEMNSEEISSFIEEVKKEITPITKKIRFLKTELNRSSPRPKLPTMGAPDAYTLGSWVRNGNVSARGDDPVIGRG